MTLKSTVCNESFESNSSIAPCLVYFQLIGFLIHIFVGLGSLILAKVLILNFHYKAQILNVECTFCHCFGKHCVKRETP